MRKIKFKNNEIYHIYNRGVDKRDVFCYDDDFLRFFNNFKEFNNNLTREERREGLAELSSANAKGAPLVEVLQYCINPNHYHLILKQLKKDGISKFMHKMHTGYANYFNYHHTRSGRLFENSYKAEHVDNIDYLRYLSGYVHGNPKIHQNYEAADWLWSSYQDYLSQEKWGDDTMHPIRKLYDSPQNYQEYVDAVILISSQKKQFE